MGRKKVFVSEDISRCGLTLVPSSSSVDSSDVLQWRCQVAVTTVVRSLPGHLVRGFRRDRPVLGSRRSYWGTYTEMKMTVNFARDQRKDSLTIGAEHGLDRDGGQDEAGG
jgi:hypothetical protein